MKSGDGFLKSEYQLTAQREPGPNQVFLSGLARAFGGALVFALPAVPASIGALLAQSQFGGDGGSSSGQHKKAEHRYESEVFLMAVGAVYLSLNVAPTQEMVLISYKMTPEHVLGLMAASLLLMHAFVYSQQFSGGSRIPQGASGWSVFLRFAVVDYALCLLVSLYMLWTFGRTDGASAAEIAMASAVLAFPAAIGAATLETARLRFQFLPPHSVRRGGLFFTRDPRRLQLALHPLGYRIP